MRIEYDEASKQFHLKEFMSLPELLSCKYRSEVARIVRRKLSILKEEFDYLRKGVVD